MIRMRKKKFFILVLFIVICSVTLTAGGLIFYGKVIDNSVTVSEENYKELYEFANKYSKLYNLQKVIDEKFLWDVDDEKMLNGVYKSMTESLGDKYSDYMTKDEMEKFRNYLDGTFSGVGINFAQDKDGNIVVLRIVEGSPASESGIKPGDYLIAVNGKKYESTEKMAVDMRGKEGTEVDITYSRDGKEKTVKITRALVTEKSVFSKVLKDKIGYIAITSFEKTTAEQFETELRNLEMKNLKGLIIDLRGNGGGYTDQGIKIADMLLPECTISYTEDKNGKKEYYNSDASGTELKYALLVDGGTASTSEILAAAVKDNKGGKLVGERTFGKGIIQGTYPFADGSAVKLTIMQFYSPKGDTIHKKGIEPDYKVKIKESDKVDKQLKKAIRLLSE